MMKSKITIVLFLLALLGLNGCDRDEIIRYDVANAFVSFTSTTTNFSFVDATNRDTAIIEIAVQASGPIVDYSRSFHVKIVDSLTNAEEANYTILDGEIPAGELKGVLRVKLFYEDLLTDSTRKLRLVFKENEYFTSGFNKYQNISVQQLSPYHELTWTDQLVMPANWRSWFTAFSKEYSRDYHLLVLEVLGDDARNLQYWNEFGGPRSNVNLVITLNRKLRKYVQDYNKAHPDNKLKHSKDGVRYSSWNSVSPVPIGEAEITFEIH